MEISNQKLLKYLNEFRSLRSVVLGDVMLNRFFYGSTRRTSLDAPARQSDLSFDFYKFLVDDDVFAWQIESPTRPRDVALCISKSGNSPNVLAALEAKRKGAATIGLTRGTAGGSMVALCDMVLAVPSKITARIQEMYILIGHMLCKALEQLVGLF
jgi:phosphoheptose isomerase